MPRLTSYTEDVGPVEVAVIGAGINGLAVARELARLGRSVLLIDQDDIGARTSAISSRLIHGGLKYLERLEINLVRESIRERSILLKHAPHLVHPYPMLIPFRRGARRPGWLICCGLALHDLLSLGKPLPRNRIVSRRRLRAGWPSLAAGGARWAGVFQDAHAPLTERLCIELAIDAQAHGATVLTHSRVEGLLNSGGRIAGIEYRDARDGTFRRVPAQVVVNAAGPWADEILGFTGRRDRRIGPTKGSHLVVDSFPGAPPSCVFFESPDDARPMFVLPWEGRYMIGTTDLPYDGDLSQIATSREEVDYLLRAVNRLIPGAELSAADVLWSYSGVRPLPYVSGLDDPAKVSRDHEIVEHDGDLCGLITLVGGKLTTHRALGELVGRRVMRMLGAPAAQSSTRRARLPGAPSGDWERYRLDRVSNSPLPEYAVKRIVDTYGTASELVERLVVERESLGAVVHAESGALAAELVYAVVEEGAQTLEDVLLRRTTIGLGADLGLSAAEAACEVLVDHAGWSAEFAEQQLERYRKQVRRFCPRGSSTRRGPR